MEQEQSIQIADVMGIAKRRGKLIAVVAGVVILSIFWIAMALPNLYSSSAVILVEPQSVDEALVNSGVRESDLNERLGLMTAEILSRNRLSKIIDDVGLYKNESKSMERSEVVDLMRSYVTVEPVLSELEETTARRGELSFNTFRILFRNERATVAAEVAQKIANDFINANIDARTEITAKSLDFMQDEIRSLSEQIESLEKQISTVKEENPGRLPEDLESNKRILQFAMNDLRDAQRIFDAATSDEAFWKNQALAAATMAGSDDQASPGYRLRALELERGSSLARGFTEKHPDVVRIEAEIALLKQQMAQTVRDGEAGIEGLGPKSIAEQNARSEQGRAGLRAIAATEDIERLRVVVADVEARIGSTPGVAERLDALNRRYEHLYTSYQDFSRRLQQAGVQATMERRQLGEKFMILESAFPAPEPSSPNRILLLILGALFGLVLGTGVGLAAEVADTSVHTTNELQSALGLPVLVSVPKIMLESDRVARSRQMVREVLAAVGIVLLCLVGGVLTYWIVNGDSGATALEVEESAPAEANEARFDLGVGRG
jgi:succinoglycan biosynthesis transport protein ExoP